MQGNAKKKRKEKKWNLDEVFFERGTSMQETNERAQRNNRDLHLEMAGDKVTYVRVY